jgi:Cof subfamily protein (haloacid dehalogenase superfamily)
MNRKLVFLDIDGTIFNDETKSISAKTRYAIDSARRNGSYVCIGTGRCKAEIGSEILDLGFDGIICAAGAYIMWKDKVIREKYLDRQLLIRMLSILKQSNSFYIMEGSEHVYVEKCLWDGMTHRAKLGDLTAGRIILFYEPVIIETEEADQISKVSKMVYYLSDYSLQRMEREMSPNGINVTELSLGLPAGNCGELTQKEYHKGEGIRFLTDYLGINLSDTLAIGDSDNDIEMLKTAGTGIVMGNAKDNVKQIADEVTDTIEQDGVYKAFLKNALITPL